MMRLVLRIAGIAFAALLLLAMQHSTPGALDMTGPIPVEGRIGEEITGRQFTAKVENVTFARKIHFKRFGRDTERDSGGLFAIVDVTLAARNSSLAVSSATWLSPTQRRFQATRRLNGAPGEISSERLEPGLPRTGRYIFELPDDQVAGGTLLLSRALGPRLDSELHIAMPARIDEIHDVLELGIGRTPNG